MELSWEIDLYSNERDPSESSLVRQSLGVDVTTMKKKLQIAWNPKHAKFCAAKVFPVFVSVLRLRVLRLQRTNEFQP
jgi:hypothetical protein